MRAAGTSASGDRAGSTRTGVLAVGVGMVLFTLVAAAAPVPTGQDGDTKLERTNARIDELFRFRIGLLLKDLGRSTGLSEEELVAARERLCAESDEWRAEHPAKLVNAPAFAWTAPPYEFEPFPMLLESDGWAEAIGEALPTEAASTLESRLDERRGAVFDSLVELLEARVGHGLCLHPAENLLLRPVLEEAAAELMEDSLVQADTQNYYYGTEPKDALLELFEDAGLAGALGGERRAIYEEIVRKDRRTDLHEWWLEIEYLIHGRDDTPGLRELLRGAADAILHRDGDEPSASRARLRPGKPNSKKAKRWDEVLRGVLNLGDEVDLDELPNRTRDPIEVRRVPYLFAVLDQRACFSEEQRADLLPLIEELVDVEPARRGGGTGMDPDLLLPAYFRVGPEGMLRQGENQMNQPSTKVKSKVQAFYEACTEDQRDVLDS